MEHFKKTTPCSSITFGFLFFNILFSICINATPVPGKGTTDTTPENYSNTTCPISKTQRFLYHKETQKCYKEKSRGPCPSNMVIYPLDNSKTFGDCDCTEKGQLPWVYHPATENCFQTFKQSHCPAGQWLVFDEDLYPACTLNPCLAKLSDDEEAPTVLYKNKCVTLGESSELCPHPESEIINFPPNEVIPKCVSDTDPYSIVKTKQLNCKPGTRRDIAGRCRTIVTSQLEFDPCRKSHGVIANSEFRKAITDIVAGLNDENN